MRVFGSILAVLLLLLVSACDQIGAFGTSTKVDDDEAEAAIVPIDLLTEAKSKGSIVYEGGSINVTVPRYFEHHYTPTGALSISGTIENPVSGGRTNGAVIAIPESLEREFSGRTISIRIVATSEPGGESYFAYSTNEVGNSGWMPVILTAEDTVATLEYKVPPMKAGLGDFIGINPNGHKITLKAIVIDILE